MATKAAPSRTPRSPSSSPMSCARSVTASEHTQTRSSGGPVPPPRPPAPSYQQRHNAPHSPPEKPYHTQSSSASSPMPSRNPSPCNRHVREIPATSRHQSPIPSSQSVPPDAFVTNTIRSISQIIPPESLIAISSHLTPCKKPCPVLFEIHLPYSLDRIAPSSHKCLPSNQLRSSVTGVLNAALNTKLPPLPAPSARILQSLKRNLKIHTIPDGASDAIPKPEPRHSPSSSQTMSSMLGLPTTYGLHPLSPHM